ncbi:MAG: S9 family peptidase [Gemmatimonadota bacterium]|nr:S9 family peptidase [Gemmatimonadota bacterium]
MRRSQPLAAFAILALSAVAMTAQQVTGAKRPFTPADYYAITNVATPEISPDGKLVAFTVVTVREKENKRHSEVWIAPTTGGSPARYTSPGFESSNPHFSPDGKYLFFTSHRPEEKATRWALRMDAPGGEAAVMEDYPRATSVSANRRVGVWTDTVDAPADSPARDTSRRAGGIYATMGKLSRPPFDAVTRPVDPKRFDGMQFTDMRFKSNDAGFVASRSETRHYPASQIWIQAYDGSPKKMLTNTSYSHRDAVISPDGRFVAFVADAALRTDSAAEAERDSLARLPYSAARDEKERDDSDIFVIAADGSGAPKRISRFASQKRSLEWSPDSKLVSFIAAPSRVKSQRIYTVSLTDEAPRNLLGDFRYEPAQYRWTPDGNIVMSAAVGGRTALFRVDAKSGAMKEILSGRRAIRGWDINARHDQIAFVATDMTHPTELYIADASGAHERRLTSFNDKLESEVAFQDGERFTYPSVGGLEIEGWLMKPFGYQAGGKYPLVLYIHGGPHSQYDEGWFDEFQNLAGAGMMVLFTNPRGSSGYGGDFTYSTRGRWGAEDYTDLMKAVDIAAARNDVDSTRMGVTGGSYGGYMTAWIETKTNRFRAAQTDRMISDWTYWYGASDAQGLTEFEFYGKPWDNFAMYDSLSPIRHVTSVRTPTLLVQSENDFRAPIGDAELWYLALRKQGVPAEFVRYPRSTHELSRSGEPWLLVDRLGRIRQWFSHWLIDDSTSGVGRAKAGITS